MLHIQLMLQTEEGGARHVGEWKGTVVPAVSDTIELQETSTSPIACYRVTERTWSPTWNAAVQGGESDIEAVVTLTVTAAATWPKAALV